MLICCICFTRSGVPLSTTVLGKIETNSRLSGTRALSDSDLRLIWHSPWQGTPDCLLSFTNSNVLVDCAFHPCVRSVIFLAIGLALCWILHLDWIDGLVVELFHLSLRTESSYWPTIVIHLLVRVHFRPLQLPKIIFQFRLWSRPILISWIMAVRWHLRILIIVCLLKHHFFRQDHLTLHWHLDLMHATLKTLLSNLI